LAVYESNSCANSRSVENLRESGRLYSEVSTPPVENLTPPVEKSTPPELECSLVSVPEPEAKLRADMAYLGRLIELYQDRGEEAAAIGDAGLLERWQCRVQGVLQEWASCQRSLTALQLVRCRVSSDALTSS